MTPQRLTDAPRFGNSTLEESIAGAYFALEAFGYCSSSRRLSPGLLAARYTVGWSARFARSLSVAANFLFASALRAMLRFNSLLGAFKRVSLYALSVNRPIRHRLHWSICRCKREPSPNQATAPRNSGGSVVCWAPEVSRYPGSMLSASPPPPRAQGTHWHLQNCRLPCSQVSHCSGTPRPSSPSYQPAGLCCFFILPGTANGTSAAVNINHPKSGIKNEADRLDW